MDNELMRTLLADNLWLSEDDFKKPQRYRRPRAPPRRPGLGPDEHDEPDPVSDNESEPPEASEAEDGELEVRPPVVDGKAELAAIRAADVYDWTGVMFFRFAYLGGDWTAAHCRVGSNAAGGFACEGLAKLWCTRYRYAKQHVFHFLEYGSRNAAIQLAREYVRRSEFFIRQYFDAADKAGFRYTEERTSAYVPHVDFRDWMLTMPITHKAFIRGHLLLAEFPLVPIDD